MKHKTYRIVEATTGTTLAESQHRGDLSAENWLTSLLDKGVIAGVPVQLQRRVMSDEEVAKLPPFANGNAQSAWEAVK